jgi:hypothetical protein
MDSLSDLDNKSSAALRHRANRQLSENLQYSDDLTPQWFVPPFWDLMHYPGIFATVTLSAIYPNLHRVLSPSPFLDKISFRIASQDELALDYNEPLGVTRTAFKLLQARRFTVPITFINVTLKNKEKHEGWIRLCPDLECLGTLRCSKLEDKLTDLKFKFGEGFTVEQIKEMKTIQTTESVTFEFTTSDHTSAFIYPRRSSMMRLDSIMKRVSKSSEERS